MPRTEVNFAEQRPLDSFSLTDGSIDVEGALRVAGAGNAVLEQYGRWQLPNRLVMPLTYPAAGLS